MEEESLLAPHSPLSSPSSPSLDTSHCSVPPASRFGDASLESRLQSRSLCGRLLPTVRCRSALSAVDPLAGSALAGLREASSESTLVRNALACAAPQTQTRRDGSALSGRSRELSSGATSTKQPPWEGEESSVSHMAHCWQMRRPIVTRAAVEVPLKHWQRQQQRQTPSECAVP